MWLWEWLCGLFAGPVWGSARRSPQWGKVRAMVLDGAACAACGTANGLEVHHIEPVHVFPEKEMDTGNLMTLCEKCHFRWGHLWDWRSWNPEVRKDAEQWAAKRISRPRK